ncbi:FAD-dependent oxidoreductase [Aspergillus tanneri]|uniref:FAD dependent oxidoreductase domain-containing protein n=1 Tax=Aspergillus tanneri TaxID=1220188 RepID=A0A5M9MLZ9_9EURO|nr:uncharacterized protein ATNIH1004_003915 [Aspergillus tanneri]KAA8648032.1 hypothetical protein ATNIH1004_003915 [Aspergillus tanneri]
MEREQDTGISILVVGGGIAGLTFAIEAHRKGHNVRVIEQRLRGERQIRRDADRIFPHCDPNDPSLAIYRSKLHNVLYEHASQLGIPVEFSATASEFFEADDHAGVVLSDGRSLTADVVVAADGVGSK